MALQKKRNWKEIIREQEASGKTIKEFCIEHGIKSNTFYLNRKKIRDGHFVEIKMPRNPIKSEPLILSCGDIRITVQPGFCKETLKNIISVLRTPV